MTKIIFTLLFIFCLGHEAAQASEKKLKFEDIQFNLSSKEIKRSNGTIHVTKYDLKAKNQDIGFLQITCRPETEKQCSLQTHFNENFRNQGLSASIQKECISLFHQFIKEQLKSDKIIYAEVSFLNYPSIKKNLGAGMKIYGIDEAGSFIFVDDLDKAKQYLSEKDKNEYKNDIPHDWSKNMQTILQEQYERESDFFKTSIELATSKKYLAEHKNIHNADDYFKMIKKIAKNNGILFEGDIKE